MGRAQSNMAYMDSPHKRKRLTDILAVWDAPAVVHPAFNATFLTDIIGPRQFALALCNSISCTMQRR